MTRAVKSLMQPTLPAMIVGRTNDGSIPPLGLGEPFALMGGDRLGPGGITHALGHDWQPAFVGAVFAACQSAIRNERFWFRLPPAKLIEDVGSKGIHAARCLARAAEVPHVIVDLTNPVIAASFGSPDEPCDALWVSPITAAMAATRIANPVVSVVGAGIYPAADAAIAEIINSATSSSWWENKLRVDIDFSEVSWIIHSEETKDPFSSRYSETGFHTRTRGFRSGMITSPLMSFNTALQEISFDYHRGRNGELLLSVVLEVLADLGLNPADQASEILELVDVRKSFFSIGDLYTELRSHFLERQYQAAMNKLIAESQDSAAPSSNHRNNNRKAIR